MRISMSSTSASGNMTPAVSAVTSSSPGMRHNTASVAAETVAVRATPRSSPISPNQSSGPRRLIVWPCASTTTCPLATT